MNPVCAVNGAMGRFVREIHPRFCIHDHIIEYTEFISGLLWRIFPLKIIEIKCQNHQPSESLVVSRPIYYYVVYAVSDHI